MKISNPPTNIAPDDADYLVATTQSQLSAEIVVGETPGGELGGSHASPTVDGTHSGSAHHASAHTPESHTSQGATAAELETLTDTSNADALHKHGASGIGLRAIVKTSAETVNNSNSVQDDDVFTWSIAADQTLLIDIYLFVDTPGAADFKYTFTGPSGIGGEHGIVAAFGNSTGDYYSGAVRGGFNGEIEWIGTQTREALHIRCTAANGGTSGNVLFRWAQVTATVGDTTIRAFASGQALDSA